MNSQIPQDHRLLKKGFIKLNGQHLESVAAATAAEKRLKVFQEDHAQLLAKTQDLETRAQAAERKAEETEAQLRGSEHRAHEAETRLEESERLVHDAEQRVTDAAHNVSLSFFGCMANSSNTPSPVIERTC